jgi:nucleoside-triphosphatase THEP1
VVLARERGVPIRGYLSPSVWSEKKQIGYNLLTLPDGQAFPFLRERGSAEAQRVGPYALLPEALALAQRIIRQGSAAPLLIVDEVGPLELEGRGVWPALADVFSRPPQKLLLVIRSVLVDSFCSRVPGGDKAIVFGTDEPKVLARILEGGRIRSVRHMARRP